MKSVGNEMYSQEMVQYSLDDKGDGINVLETLFDPYAPYSLMVDHISVICLLYNMFFKKECFAQEQEYRMVFLCVHKREHQVPENSIPVEYRIKDEVFIPFIRMKLGDISCLKSVCVGTKNTSDLAVKGLRHYFGSRNLEVHVRKSEIPLRY